MSGVAGLLLTGGASNRLGRDKALIDLDGAILADRLAALLASSTSPVFEVGPGYSSLRATREEPAGAGPLAAIAAGARALSLAGHNEGAIVLACDLPLLQIEVLDLLLAWPGSGSVLPVVAGRAQPLCARWSATNLAAANGALARGERSLRSLPDRTNATLLGEKEWGHLTDGAAFADIDTADDLRRAHQLLARRARATVAARDAQQIGAVSFTDCSRS